MDVPLTYEDIRLALLEDNCVLHPSLMIRTDVMKQLGGYNEKYVYSSDYDLVCRLALMGKIENLPDKLTKPKGENEIRTALIFKQRSIYLLECLERQCLVKNILTEKMVEKLNGFHHLKLCPEKTQFLLDLYAGVRLRKNCVPCEPIESKSITFVIPLRIDSKEREENLDMLLALLSRMEGVDILLLEGDSTYSGAYPFRNPES